MDRLDHYLRPRPRHGWVFVLFAGLILAGAAWLGYQAYRQHQTSLLAEAGNARLRSQLVQKVEPVDSKEQQAEQKHWASIKAERDFPWQTVLIAMENTAAKDIELLEFLPEKRNRQLVLKGEAKDQKALVAYIEALSAQPALRQVHLAHQQALVRDRLETVEFEIKARL
ncbi:PilN domain-containing protein [Chitinimonas naiadis]